MEKNQRSKWTLVKLLLRVFIECVHSNSFFFMFGKAYAGSQTLQSIILISTGTNKDGGYFAPKWLFLCMYIGLTVIWAALNTFALEVIAFIDIISIWWQVIGGTVIVILLPLVAMTTQSASYVFTNFELAPATTGISSKPYAMILSFLVSQYSLYGYDAAAHLTEETKDESEIQSHVVP